MSELRKAAVELQGHAWLARFERADESNKYNEMSPVACNQIAGYVKWFIDEVLAKHPADDDEPVTEEWMSEIGFKDGRLKNELGYDCMSTYLRIDDIGQWYYGTDYGMELDAEVMLPSDRKTRGDVRRLCRALGITLTEPKQCTS